MKKLTLFIIGIGLLSQLMIKAQTKSASAKSNQVPQREVKNVEVEPTAPVTDEPVFEFCEQEPTFPGGESTLMQFLSNNIKYPTEARNKNIEGKVFVQFIVEVDGSISNIRVLRGLGFGCDEEVIRVLNLMPKWKCGKQNGKAIRAFMKLPVNFALG